jgi:tetratricopeptide (TPR) repeat protein
LPILGHLGLATECVVWIDRITSAVGATPTPDQVLAIEVARSGALAFGNTRGQEAKECRRRICALDGKVAGTQKQMQVLFAQYGQAYSEGRFRDCLRFGERMRLIAETADDMEATSVADHSIGRALFYLGEITGARIAIEKSLSHGLTLGRRGFRTHCMFDERVAAFSNLAKIFMLQGSAERALEVVAENIQRANAMGHGNTICVALGWAGCGIALECADLATAQKYIQMLTKTAAASSELGTWSHVANVFAGVLLSRQGEHTAAIGALKAAIEDLRPACMWNLLTMGLGYLATALNAAEHHREAAETIEEALRRCEQSEEHWCLPPFLITRADSSFKAGLCDAQQAGDVLYRALTIADAQGAHFWRAKVLNALG